jgi:hypothetical protein
VEKKGRNSMTDEIKVRITLPDVWTVYMWAIYAEARRQITDAGGDLVLARYAGACALVKKGLVHLDHPALKAYVLAETIDDVPLGVVGVLVAQVAVPIETALNSFFWD